MHSIVCYRCPVSAWNVYMVVWYCMFLRRAQSIKAEMLDCDIEGASNSHGYLTCSPRQRALVYLHAFEVAIRENEAPVDANTGPS